MERRTVRIWSAGDHLSVSQVSSEHYGDGLVLRDEPLRISRQIRPSLSNNFQPAPMQKQTRGRSSPILGWYIFVKNRTLGGLIGYSSGRNSSSLNTPPMNGYQLRAWISHRYTRTFKCRSFRTCNSNIEIAQVILVWRGSDTRSRISCKSLGFLQIV